MRERVREKKKIKTLSTPELGATPTHFLSCVLQDGRSFHKKKKKKKKSVHIISTYLDLTLSRARFSFTRRTELAVQYYLIIIAQKARNWMVGIVYVKSLGIVILSYSKSRVSAYIFPLIAVSALERQIYSLVLVRANLQSFFRTRGMDTTWTHNERKS